jgi:ABC-type transport system involved in cytochrome bd biosynthesis fused ATPase/permease subunit
VESVNHTISIKSTNFSWEENSAKPTLRNINLEVRSGEKVTKHVSNIFLLVSGILSFC